MTLSLTIKVCLHSSILVFSLYFYKINLTFCILLVLSFKYIVNLSHVIKPMRYISVSIKHMNMDCFVSRCVSNMVFRVSILFSI